MWGRVYASHSVTMNEHFMYALAASSFCLSTQLFDTSGCGPVSRIFNCYDPDRSYKNKSVSLEAYIKHLQKNHCDVTNPANPESCSDPDSSYVPASTYVPTSTCPGVTQTPVVTQTCGTLQRVQQRWTKVWLSLAFVPLAGWDPASRCTEPCRERSIKASRAIKKKTLLN